MTVSLKDDEGTQISNEENLVDKGFNPDYQEVQASNLTAFVTIDFSEDLDMWYEFKDSTEEWTFDPDNYIATYQW